jgi:hypothetical protein
MQTPEHSPRAPRRLRRLARTRKVTAMERGEPPKQPESSRQQSATEPVSPQPGDWPPNTWWP